MCNNYEENEIVRAIPFQYPTEETSSIINDNNILGLFDFLYGYVLTSKHPRLTLTALLYSAGYDIGNLYGCDNTCRSISKTMGITHIQLYKEIQSISSSLGLIPRINNNNR